MKRCAAALLASITPAAHGRGALGQVAQAGDRPPRRLESSEPLTSPATMYGKIDIRLWFVRAEADLPASA
jgi:hypothetical protein